MHLLRYIIETIGKYLQRNRNNLIFQNRIWIFCLYFLQIKRVRYLLHILRIKAIRFARDVKNSCTISIRFARDIKNSCTRNKCRTNIDCCFNEKNTLPRFWKKYVFHVFLSCFFFVPCTTVSQFLSLLPRKYSTIVAFDKIANRAAVLTRVERCNL